MVNWFHIGQLAKTAVRISISTFIGEQSDKRILQALSSTRKEFFDYTHYHKETGNKSISDFNHPRNEIWLDYISDTGDGFNPTYAVAYYSSNPGLDLSFGGKSYSTKRGEVLIFGGDEVYPTPSRENYRKRLVVPFETAFGDDKPEFRPHVFAIPGNHDWYDGLSAFTRLFCSDLNRRFAGWFTRQRRSYFALKLPGNWWLLGSDGQLQSDIDTPQIEYFRSVAERHMKEGDRVILCISQPNWIYAAKYKKFNEIYDESDLLYLQNEILSKKNIGVKVYLSGDLHHYRRHEEKHAKDPEAKVQKITAGGGGAFLHPTHDADVDEISEDFGIGKETKRHFNLKKSYPDVKKSRMLSFRDLLFLFLNPGFGIVTALFYLLTAWFVSSAIDLKNFENPTGFFDSLYLAIKFTFFAFLDNPLTAIWIALVLTAFIIFTDTHSKFYQYLAGFIHCCAHFSAIFYIGWGSVIFAVYLFKDHETLIFLFAMMMVFISGWIVGSTIMGVYLFVSQFFFGRHNDEAFSALKIQDYKNFLRLHISSDGDLTIFPVKIEKCPRNWRNRRENEKEKIKSFIVPADGSGAELIEEPVVLKRKKNSLIIL